MYTVEPPLKETPNKGNLSIMNRITCPKTSLSYNANTFITSEERSIMNRITCPKSYVIQRFHCIYQPFQKCMRLYNLYNIVYIYIIMYLWLASL